MNKKVMTLAITIIILIMAIIIIVYEDSGKSDTEEIIGFWKLTQTIQENNQASQSDLTISNITEFNPLFEFMPNGTLCRYSLQNNNYYIRDLCVSYVSNEGKVSTTGFGVEINFFMEENKLKGVFITAYEGKITYVFDKIASPENIIADPSQENPYVGQAASAAVINAPFFVEAFSAVNDGCSGKDCINLEIVNHGEQDIFLISAEITIKVGGTGKCSVIDNSSLGSWLANIKKQFSFVCPSSSTYTGTSIAGDIEMKFKNIGSSLIQTTAGGIRVVVQ